MTSFERHGVVALSTIVISHSAVTNDMMHTEYDSATFFSDMLLLLGMFGMGVYSVLVLIALILLAFQSRHKRNISFWISAITSLPFLLALMILWPYMTKALDNDPSRGLLLLINTVLLFFVWIAPTVQYHLMRRNTQKAFGSQFE